MRNVLFNLVIFLLLSIGISCKSNNSSTDYLQKVLGNLEKIESATYLSLTEIWQPGDTIPQGVYSRVYKEFSNPVDTTIGASFVWYNAEDSTKFIYCYNGVISAYVNRDEKIIDVDNFIRDRGFSFRLVPPPFFNYTKNIIKYALTTKDSIILDFKELDKYYYCKLVINEDKQVEFFGKACYMPKNPYTLDPTSIYELWINKSNNLPYKVRREMSHQISASTVSNVELNKLSIADFNIQDYFPNDYEIRKSGEANKEKKESNLIGKKAPSWILNDKNEQSVTLSDLKGKVSLIQFTGIGCGVCIISIPFLKELREEYSEDDLGLVAIETWVRRTQSLQNYSKKYGINYSLLSGTDEVDKNYEINGFVPVFFYIG